MSSREQMASRRPSSALAGRSRGGWQAAPPGRLLPQHSQPFRVACKKLAPKQNKKKRFWEVVSQRRREQPEGGGRCGEEGGRENRQTPQYFPRQAGWLGRDHRLRPSQPVAPELPGLSFTSFLLAVALICPAGMEEGGDNLGRGAYWVVLPLHPPRPRGLRAALLRLPAPFQPLQLPRLLGSSHLPAFFVKPVEENPESLQSSGLQGRRQSRDGERG